VVFLNGVSLDQTEYTATSGTSVVLGAGAALNDELVIVAFKSFVTADMVPASTGGTYAGAVRFAAGSASVPSISVSGDTNTGIFYPAADTVAIGTGGTEALRVNSSQTLTFVRSTLASYQWTAWNPSDILGTTTTAPSTGTTDDSNYVTMSNSSGTLTVTFDVAGTYLVCINGIAFHANAYIYDTFYTNLGGTATRRIGRDDPNNWADGSNDGNMSITTSFYVSATASQTLTIQPRYRVSASGGTGSQHTAYCNATIQYCGG
jgi:hypothetical protein